jgi:CRISPR/Cas system-associated protein Cas10 (large subunit of type III CRISPR-Cas system)
MDTNKYNTSVSLLCATCGCADSSFDTEADTGPITCTSCVRIFNKDELIRENSESIELHTNEIKNQICKDLSDHVRKSIKKAFSGNKNIRIK